MEGDRRGKPAGLLEKQRGGHSQRGNRQPGEWRMINRKKCRTANHGAPAAPFAVQRPKKQAAEKIFFREGGTGPGYHLEDEVELQYYRLQKISEGQIDLSTGDGKPLKGPSDVGTGQEDPQIKLSELIDILNERFGTDFTQADQLFFDQIQEEAIESETLKKAAAANSKDDFRYVFEKAFEGLVIDRMEGNEEIFGKLMGDGEFRKLAVEYLLHKVYGALKKTTTDSTVAGG